MKRNKSLNRKKAISLIVLVITIIIIVIIATTGVILVANSGIFHSSTELTFKNDMSQYSDRIKNYFGSKVSDGNENIRISGENLVEYIPELKDSKYLDKLYVLDGELVIDGSKITEDEKNWAKEIGIHVSDSLEIIGLDVVTTENTIEIKSINTSGDLTKGVKYKFKLDDNEKESTTSSYTFGKLESGKYYLVNVSIVSSEGQELASYKKNIKTRINNDVVDIKLSTENWTKGPIKVTLEYENIPQAYKIQYKIGKEEFKDYTKEFEVTENNTFIYARLYNKDVGRDTSNNYVEIKNIDKEVPLKPTAISTTSGINSIKVRASGSQDSLSGILGYKYSLDGITYTSTIKAYDDYTFTNINADTIKTIYTKAVDNVGNESEVYSKDWSTWEASEKVKISIDPAEDLWTNKAVTVSLSHQSIPTNYIMQYRINNGSWTDGYTAKVTENRTKIEARLYNKNLNDEIGLNSLTIGNIDRIAPNVISAEFNPTKNTIEVSNIVAKDEGGSGIANYELSIKKHSDIYYTPYTSEQNKYTFEGLVKDTLYDIHIRVYDKAGNVSDYYSKSIPTVCIITLDSQGADSGKEGTKTIYEKYEKGFYDTEDCTNKITSISIPQKTGFVFDGYYTEKNGKGTKMIDENGNITSNFNNTYYTSAGTLYANWVAKKITVIFMRNTTANDTTSDTQEFTYGVTGQSFSAKGWTKKGYTLLGWHEDKNSTAKRYNITSGVTNAWIESKYNASSNHTVTLYAIWQPNTYTVKYNGNGATGGTTANSSHTYDVDKKLTKNGYTRAYTVTYNHNYTGSTNTTKTATYSFVNWNTAANGSGTKYVNEATVKNLTDKNNDTFNLYAIWKSASLTYVPTRTGYVFDGWFEDAECTKRATSNNGVYTPTVNKTLYAKWNANRYTVKYNGNGATGGTTADSLHAYDVDKKLTKNGYTRAYTVTYNHNYTGSTDISKTATYSFVNWNTKADGTGTKYANEAIVKNLTNKNNDTFNLYAIWKSASITYVPTRNDSNGNVYLFTGWYKEATCQNRVTDENGVYTPNGTITTLYAGWKQVYYQNTSLGKYYVTLNEAFSEVQNTTPPNTIIVLSNVTETNSATLASGKIVNLNTNGKNITFNGAYGITNNGTLNLVGSGKISGSKAHVIHNIGILNIATCTITNTTNGSTRAIWNDYNGTVNMSSGTVSNSVTDVDIKSSGDITPFAIANGGTFNFTGGTIRSNSSGNERQYGILTAGIFIMSGGKIETCGTAIYMKDKYENTKNKGTNITGGIISNTSARVAINNNSNGTLTISGGNEIQITSASSKGIYLSGAGKVNITASNLTVSGSENAISNKSTGTISISGASTFIAKNGACVENEGTGSIEIKAGTFNGNTYGIKNYSTGKVTVTNGKITGKTGISVGSGGTLTLGEYDPNDKTQDPPSTETPLITDSSTGIEVGGAGNINVFNFYDGRIVASNGSAGAAIHIDSTKIKTPTGYRVVYENSGRIAYLSNKYTVNYDYSTNGGTSTTAKNSTLTYNSDIDLTPTATKDDGWEFVGWNTNKDAKTKLTSVKVTEDITLYAIYKKTVTATCNYYNGLVTTRSGTMYNNATSVSVKLPKIEKITPSTVTYNPRGWSESPNSDANKDADSEASVYLSSNKTYYASYSAEIPVNIYYCGGDGTPTTAGNKVLKDTVSGTRYVNYKRGVKESPITIPDVVKNSKGFCGTEYSGVSKEKNSITDSTLDTSSTTYYAFYKKNVTLYYYNGSKHTSSVVKRNVTTDGTTYTSKEGSTIPTPSSYDGAAFKGWSYTNDAVNARAFNATAVDVLYAYYQKTITVSYNKNGGTGTIASVSDTKTYISKAVSTNASTAITTIKPTIKVSSGSGFTKTGYVFSGWNTKADETGTDYTKSTAYTFSSNTTLYAKWTEKYILITFYSNGATEMGSAGKALSSDKKTSTQTTTITWTNRNRHKNTEGTYVTGVDLLNCTSLFSRTGYAIPSDAQAWRYNSATSTTYINQANQNFTSYFGSNVKTEISLYANWQEKKLRVYFYPNGGTAKSGHELITTSGDAHVGASTTYNEVNYSEASDYDLYNCTTLFSKTGYTVPSDAHAWRYNSSTSNTYINQASANLTSYFGSGVVSSIKLYANWTLATYKITLDKNGGTGGASAVYEWYSKGIYKESSHTNLVTGASGGGITTPTKANHRFDGYYTTKTGGTQLINGGGYLNSAFTNKYFTSNATIYARWKCTHVFGDYVTVGNENHQRTCTLCGFTQTASHKTSTTVCNSKTLVIGNLITTNSERYIYESKCSNYSVCKGTVMYNRKISDGKLSSGTIMNYSKFYDVNGNLVGYDKCPRTKCSVCGAWFIP